MKTPVLAALLGSVGCASEGATPAPPFSSSSDEARDDVRVGDEGSADRVSADALMAGAFSLPVSLSDVTEPAGLGVDLFPGLTLDALLLVEYTSASDDDDSVELLLGWGSSSSFARETISQKPQPTTSCSGTMKSDSTTASCDGMWTDMGSTTLGGLYAADGPGATVLDAELRADLSERGGVLSLEDLSITGSLDLDTLRSELGYVSSVLCLAVGGCEPCPDDGKRTCTPFAIQGLSGDQVVGLELVEY